jgi:hypothetical protein
MSDPLHRVFTYHFPKGQSCYCNLAALPFIHHDYNECTLIQGCIKRLAIGANKCNPCLIVLREYYSVPAKPTSQMLPIFLTIKCFLTYCIMAGMSRMIVEALGS